MTASGESDRHSVERVLGNATAEATTAGWGFQNQTDMVILDGGDRIVLQRYRSRADAEYRLQVIQALRDPGAAVGIAIAKVRAFDLEADPPWINRGASRPAGCPRRGVGSRAPRPRGFRARHPRRRACARVGPVSGPSGGTAHGDFSPVNVLSDGRSLTGLVDFESVRLADPPVRGGVVGVVSGFSPPAVRETASPQFLAGAGVDTNDTELLPRIRSLQLMRMLELLAGDSLAPGIRRTVTNRLSISLRRKAP